MAQKGKYEQSKLPVLRDDVYQGNPLIQARKEFGMLEVRIFLLGLRGLNPHFSLKDQNYDEKFPELFIPTARLTELFGGNTWYLHDLENLCDKLFDSKVHLRHEDGGFTIMHIFRLLKYEPEDGLYLQFDELMRPYLLDLFESKGYTKISVEQIFYLTSPYAVRLVELMLQYQNIPEFKIRLEITREMTIDELKFAMNVPADAYEGRLDNFRQKVLDDPIAEINEKTIYKMSYTVIKQGRNVTGFKFTMNTTAAPVEDGRLKCVNKAIDRLCKLGFSLESARAILAKCEDENDCLNRIATAQLLLERQNGRGDKPIENNLGFLRQAIIENWRPERRSKILSSKVATPKPKKTPKPKEIFDNNRKQKAKMTESEMPPPLPTKQPLSEYAVEMLKDLLKDPKQKRYVEPVLKSSGWTLKEFKAKYLAGASR